MSFTKQSASLRGCAGATSTVATADMNGDNTDWSAGDIEDVIRRAIEDGKQALAAQEIQSSIESDSNLTEHTTVGVIGTVQSEVVEENGRPFYDPCKDADLGMDSDSGDSDLGSDDFSSVADDDEDCEFACALKSWSVWLAEELPDEDESDDPSCNVRAAKRARRSNVAPRTRSRTGAQDGTLL